MLSYAGINLSVYTDTMAEELAKRMSLKDVLVHTLHPWPGDCSSTFWQFQNQQSVHPGEVYWPTHASRFSVAQFVISTEMKLAIEQQIYALGGYAPADLVMTEERYSPSLGGGNTGGFSTVNTLTFKNLYYLPPYPLFRTDVTQPYTQAWLMTLVDKRFWWFYLAPPMISSGDTTWANLISSIAGGLGTTINSDIPNSAYLTPPTDLANGFTRLPEFLDYVMDLVGMRFVVGLDGSYYAYNSDTSSGLYNANVTLGNALRYSGKESDILDMTAALPDQVVVRFNRTDGGVLGQQTYDVSTLLINLSAAGEFLGTSDNQQAKYFHRDFPTADYSGGTLQNSANLYSLTQQIATDWYRYRGKKCNATYAGMLPWTPEGISSELRWIYKKDLVATRIRSLPTQLEKPRGGTEVIRGSPSFIGGGGGGPNFYATTNFYSGITLYGGTINLLSGATIPATVNSGNINNTNLAVFTWPIRVFPTVITSISGGILQASGYPKVFLDPSSGNNLTGVERGFDGQILFVQYPGEMSGSLNFQHNAAGLDSVWNPLLDTYTLWPGDGGILEYDGTSGVWRWDHPTFGAGGTSTSGNRSLPDEYSCRQILFGSGLTTVSSGGEVLVYVNSGIGGSTSAVTNVSKQVFLGASVVVSGAYRNILAITLPTSGATYQLLAKARGSAQSSGGEIGISVDLFDTVQNFELSGSQSLMFDVVSPTIGNLYYGNCTIPQIFVNANSGTVIQLRGKTNHSSTYFTASVDADTDGMGGTSLEYIQLQ